MEIRTFRAPTIREALAAVRRELGPGAAVLHTRELNTGPLARLLRGPSIEVAARGADPSADPTPPPAADTEPLDFPLLAGAAPADDAHASPPPPRFNDRVSSRLDDLHRMVEALGDRPRATAPALATSPAPAPALADDGPLPDAFFRAFTDLLEADVDQQVARELIDAARRELPEAAHDEPELIAEHIAASVRERTPTRGPIAVEAGRRRVVALVGPTGVGKTTTIAKLAANFRIRDRRAVGLITVDTYRVAAVEQLRTYADIIDLPMEVVATPREMRAAVERLGDRELILIDTAGRSPRDEVRLQELRAMLGEAAPDETHLVLSATTTRRGLRDTVRRFAPVGVDALLLTKLDEASTLGHVVGVADAAAEPLPISYLTDGQDVPEDIRVADAAGFAARLLSAEAP